MKITDFAIIFVLIVIPLIIHAQWSSAETNTYNQLNKKYDEAMTAATQDASKEILLSIGSNPNYHIGYPSLKYYEIDKDAVFDTYMHTLSLNFQTEDKNTKDVLQRYIPVFAIVEYDGVSLNVYKTFKKNGETQWDRVWLPKIPFSYKDNKGSIVSFTLDDYVTVYDVKLKEWIEGKRLEVAQESDISILKDKDSFERIRRNTIINTLQENFAYYINEHNVYTKHLGITYKFTIPLISKEDWYNTVDDIGVFAFFQGYPYQLGNQYYNEFAFAGSKIMKTDRILATTVNKKKVYYKESCGYSYPVEEIYSSEKEAAKKGYMPLYCENQ